MKVEELLKPRIKILHDWPGVSGKVKVGEVIPVDDEFDEPMFWIGGEPFLMDKIRDYPFLFKELEWWEEREEKDMPEYVKIPHFPNGENDFIIERVDGYFIKHNFTDIGYFGIKYKDAGGVFYSNIYPATKQDYEAQIKKINTSI